MLGINKILNKVNLIKNKNFLNINYSLDGIIIFALLISVIFTHLFYFKFTKYYFQFSELLFLIGCVYLLKNIKIYRKYQLNKIDFTFIFLSLILILNFIFHPKQEVAIQVVSTLYLISFYFLFSIFLKSVPPTTLIKILSETSYFILWILIFIGLLGLPLYYFFGIDKFVLVYKNYPYFGDVLRIRGFNYSPNLYISIIAFFLCLARFFNRITYIQILLIGIIALLTLTKEAALLMGLLIIFSFDKLIDLKFYLKKLILFVFCFIYLFFSLFFISFNNSPSILTNKLLLSESPIFKISNFEVYTTTYFELLKSGLILFKENFYFGVGISQFQIQLYHLIDRGLYQNYFDLYRPHDSYFGIASELGVLYLFFIFFMFMIIFFMFKKNKDKVLHPIVLLSLYFMSESVCIGSFHFRHYYIFFAILPVLLSFHENTNFKNQN